MSAEDRGTKDASKDDQRDNEEEEEAEDSSGDDSPDGSGSEDDSDEADEESTPPPPIELPNRTTRGKRLRQVSLVHPHCVFADDDCCLVSISATSTAALSAAHIVSIIYYNAFSAGRGSNKVTTRLREPRPCMRSLVVLGLRREVPQDSQKSTVYCSFSSFRDGLLPLVVKVRLRTARSAAGCFGDHA